MPALVRPNAAIGRLLGKDLVDIESPLNSLTGMTSLLVTRKSIQEHPQIVGGICRALYNAFVWAMANPEQTMIAHFHRYPNIIPPDQSFDDAVKSGVQDMVGATADLAKPGDDGTFGWIEPTHREQLVDTLYRTGLLEDKVDVNKYVDDDFKSDCGNVDVPAITAEAKAWTAK